MYYLMLLIPAILWGSIGVFLDGILISSTQIAFYRLSFASITLIIFYIFSKNKADINKIKANLVKLICAGACIGGNWVALFEAYKLSSVSLGTVVYYISPILVILASPFFYKEKLTITKIIGSATAFLGLCAVSLSVSIGQVKIEGITFAFIGAILYAIVCLINKSITEISGFNVAMIELIIGAIIIAFYTFVISGETLVYPGDKYMINLIILGVVHTGIAYGVYMTAIQKVPMQTTAICSFADPLSAIIFSAVFLNEKMTQIQIIGAVCIIGGAFFAEIYKGKNKKTHW